MGEALAFFISFRTYGSWLHGDVRGSVDQEHRTYGEAFAEANARWEAAERGRMKGPRVTMSEAQREVVRRTIAEVARERGWKVHAENVREEHVHVVVTAAGMTPERVMNDLKAWSTRRLREAGLAGEGKMWSRHGSTRQLWEEKGVEAAMHYVGELQ